MTILLIRVFVTSFRGRRFNALQNPPLIFIVVVDSSVLGLHGPGVFLRRFVLFMVSSLVHFCHQARKKVDRCRVRNSVLRVRVTVLGFRDAIIFWSIVNSSINVAVIVGGRVRFYRAEGLLVSFGARRVLLNGCVPVIPPKNTAGFVAGGFVHIISRYFWHVWWGSSASAEYVRCFPVFVGAGDYCGGLSGEFQYGRLSGVAARGLSRGTLGDRALDVWVHFKRVCVLGVLGGHVGFILIRFCVVLRRFEVFFSPVLVGISCAFFGLSFDLVILLVFEVVCCLGVRELPFTF